MGGRGKVREIGGGGGGRCKTVGADKCLQLWLLHSGSIQEYIDLACMGC